MSNQQPDWHYVREERIGDIVLFIRTIFLNETQEDFARRLLFPSRKNVAAIEKESNVELLKNDDLIKLEIFLLDNLSTSKSVGATAIRNLYKQIHEERQKRISTRKAMTPTENKSKNRKVTTKKSNLVSSIETKIDKTKTKNLLLKSH